jgi:hypothetical protein
MSAAVTQLDGRLGAIEVRVGGIEHEVTPNSGESMRDTVDRIEAAMPVAPPTVQATTPHRRR